jgi:MFS family permease
MAKYNKTMILSIMEASSYNAFYIATQGFIFTTLALYFNASPLYISIMTSFPIIAQMFQIFTPKVNNMIGSRKKGMVVNAFVSRSLFLVLPILIFLDVRSNNSLLLIILLFSFFGTFVGNTWTALMKEVVPFDLRGKYFGIRNIFSSIAGMVMLFLYTKLLELPNLKTGLLFVTILMSFFAILSAFLLSKHEFPQNNGEEKFLKINLAQPFKDKNFRNYLIFIFFWNFVIEFSKPYFSYFEVAILNVDYNYLAAMSILNSVVAILLYLVYGALADAFGSKNVLTLGIFLSTFSPLMYFLMTPSNYRSILFLNAIFSAFAWSAINLSIFNLLLELTKDPSENYIAANSLMGGMAAISASLIGGSVANVLKDTQINFLGDTYHGIQIIFIIGFVLRIISVTILSEVEAIQKPMRYKGVFSTEGTLSRSRETDMPFVEFFQKRKPPLKDKQYTQEQPENDENKEPQKSEESNKQSSPTTDEEQLKQE